jgi:hypothetical protein
VFYLLDNNPQIHQSENHHKNDSQIMKMWIRRCAVFLPVLATLACPVATHAMQPLSTLKTIYGKTYEDCHVLQRDPDGIYISHSRGMAKLLYADLAENDRNSLGYDAKKEASYNEARAKKREKMREEVREYRMEVARAQAFAVEQQRMASAAQMGYGYAPSPSYYDSGLPLLASWGTGYPFDNGYGSGFGGGRGCYSPFGNRFFPKAHFGSVTFQNDNCVDNRHHGGGGNSNYFNVIGNPVRPVRQVKVPFATPALSGATPPLAPAARNIARPSVTVRATAVGGGGRR